jgi:hypothetical protein
MTTVTLPRFVYVFAALMIAAAALYFAFVLVNQYFLPIQVGVAEVTHKEYRPFEEKHQLQNIGGRMQPVKITVPEMWVFTLSIEGKSSEFAVSQTQFQSTEIGARFEVRFKRHRISRKWQVIDIVRQVGG